MLATSQRRRRSLVTLAVIAALAGCADRSPPQPPATSILAVPTTTGAQTTTTTVAVSRDLIAQEALAAHLQAWEVFTSAMRTLDPAGLDAAFAGSALATATGQVADQAARGRPVRIDITHRPRVAVVDLDERAVIVEDTYINRSVELDPASGQPLGAVTPREVHEQRSLQWLDGTWKVVLVTRIQQEGAG